MRVLFFGDSITQGFWGIEGGWVERLRKHYDFLAAKNLRNHSQPEIFNLGIDGDTSENLLARIADETKVRKWPDDPQVVVIAIGTNDSLFEDSKQWVALEDFKGNLSKIIEGLKSLVEGILLVGIPACDERKTMPVFWGDTLHYTNAELEKYEEIVKQIAEKHKLPFAQIFSSFKTKLDQGEDLLADGLHPNDAGHQAITEMVLPELDKLLGSIT